jgi:2-iminobutanoate/2-iminopropanoate deaminase
MTRKVLEASGAPKPVGPYSPAVQVGDYVYLSGQGGVDPVSGKFASDIKGQTKQTLENLQAVLRGANLSMADLFKVSVFLRNASDFSAMNEVYRTFFLKDPPARTTIVTELLFPEMLIEIDAAAYARKD